MEGRVVELEIDSRALAGTRSATRRAGRSWPGSRRAAAPGCRRSTSSTASPARGRGWLNVSAFQPTVPERIDALVAAGEVPPFVAVFPDGFTGVGGTQWIERAGGRALPGLRRRRGGGARRGAHSGRSRARGARRGRQELRRLRRAAHGPRPAGRLRPRRLPLRRRVLRVLLPRRTSRRRRPRCSARRTRGLARRRTRRRARETKLARRRSPRPEHARDGRPLLARSGGAARAGAPLRAARPGGSARTSGRAGSSTIRCASCPRALDAYRRLASVFLDCGTRDEYHLRWGARMVAEALRAGGVAVEHQEFEDGHMGINYRYDASLRYLVAAPGALTLVRSGRAATHSPKMAA